METELSRVIAENKSLRYTSFKNNRIA